MSKLNIIQPKKCTHLVYLARNFHDPVSARLQGSLITSLARLRSSVGRWRLLVWCGGAEFWTSLNLCLCLIWAFCKPIYAVFLWLFMRWRSNIFWSLFKWIGVWSWGGWWVFHCKLYNFGFALNAILVRGCYWSSSSLFYGYRHCTKVFFVCISVLW